jgi:branched-chain amino acid transport system substrate-binding protein
MRPRRHRRPKIVLCACITLAGLLAAACRSPGESGGAGSEGPIRMALLSPTTGVVAAAGTDMLNGWRLYWKVNGDEVAGRKVEWIHEDTAGDPQTGLQKARKVVDQDDVSVVVGPLLANVGYAIAEYLETQPSVIGLNPVASADDLSQRTPVDNYLRVGGWQSSTPHHVAGRWAAEQDYERVITLCQDYAFGHEVCGGFINAFTDMGGQIVKNLWAPLGTSDYSSYLAQIDPKDADAVFMITVGADSGRVIKQWEDFGLKGKIQLIAGETTLEQSLLRAMGDEALGLDSFGHYAEGRDSPATQDFVAAYEKEYGDIPSYYSCATYTAAQWFAKGAEEADGALGDTTAFLQTLKGVELEDSCLGPMSLDEHGGTVLTVYRRKVVKDDEGRLMNEAVEEFPGVSQFFWYDAEAFLEQPVYSRDYLGEDWPKSCADFAEEPCPLEQ